MLEVTKKNFKIRKSALIHGYLNLWFQTKTPIDDMWRFNVPQLKEFLTLSVKDRCQLNCFIYIKDFNT
jgi:hypothetical protein